MSRSAPPTDEPFFVGYLNTPPALGALLGRIAFVVVGILAACALLIALHQRSPGTGRWAYGELTSVEGVVTAEPYPAVTTGADTRLIVGEGKVAADVTMLDGRIARFIGSELDRDERRMLEVAQVPEAVGDAARLAFRSTGERRTLRGEIVDPKCYLGAMKPGDGKPHKACAALCLRGGIPPMLRTTGAAGQVELYLLVERGGRAFSGEALERLIDVVGEPVEVAGTTGTFGNIRTLELAAADVRRP